MTDALKRGAKAPRALVIGGSLAGLFTATALCAVGWRVDVFERSPSALDSRGGGIVLQPEVVQAFRFAGIQHAGALGVRSDDRIFLDRHGQVLQRMAMPQTQTSWSLVHGTLARALPEGIVHRGETLEGFDTEGPTVTARFANGRVERGDLLVGADGPLSTVRATLLPQLAPTYAGYTAWRGLLPERALPARATDQLTGSFAFQDGPGFQFLAYLVPGLDEDTTPGERRWNWVWHRRLDAGAPLDAAMTDIQGRRRAYSVPPGALRPQIANDLRDAARAHLAPSFADMVAATEEPFAQAITDLRVPRMVLGRAVVLGDAAFIPRPHTAGGAAKAAVDAMVLAQALRASSDIDQALAGWNRAQMRVGTAMCDRGIALGNSIVGLGGAGR